MSSKSMCISCLRVAQRSRIRPRPFKSFRVHLTPSIRLSSTSTSHQSNIEQDIYEITGKSASLKLKSDGKSDTSRLLVSQDDLFHSFSKSPIPSLRQRAAFMKSNAYCSHPSHNRSRIATSDADSESRKPINGGVEPALVSYECEYCGIPVSCSEEHYAEDFEEHMKYCDTLRQANEDDHDIRSGRQFLEFDYQGAGIEEAMINFTNWDTLLYTREFDAINEERNLRHATKLLTYPVTIGSVIHELSPYSLRREGRLTAEGLRSFAALRYNLHPPRTGEGQKISQLRPTPPPMRIFVLGARGESSLPREVWLQLAYLFPRVQFHVILIGPESMINRDGEFPLPERTARNPFGAVIEDGFSRDMKISTYVNYFDPLYKAGHFAPFDAYFDAFVLFHPGLGHPSSSHEWTETVGMLLETKCPVIATGYTQLDMERDRDWLSKTAGGEVDVLLEPGENRFRSLRWDINDLEPHDVSAGNWGVWAFRGKRYEAQKREERIVS